MKLICKSLVAATFMALTVVGCAPSISPDTYSTATANQVNRVVAGKIVSAREVQVSGSSSGSNMVGTLAGGSLGAIAAGTNIGQGYGSAAAAIGGAVVGGMLGNYAEKKITSQTGMEYVVKTDQGEMLSVVQSLTPRYSVGQRVLVQYGAKARITLDPSYNQ